MLSKGLLHTNTEGTSAGVRPLADSILVFGLKLRRGAPEVVIPACLGKDVRMKT